MLRFLPAGGEAGIQHDSGCFPDRRDHGGVAPADPDRTPDGASARHVQCDLLCRHRSDNRSQGAGGLRCADPGDHPGGGRRQAGVVRGWRLHRWQRWAHLDARGHGSFADRRVLLHHRRPGCEPGRDQRLPLSGGGRRVGYHHAADALPDPLGRPAVDQAGQGHAAPAGAGVRLLRRLAAQHPAAG
ncbi:hypothetical protein D9M73_167870 [compost metagenome]